MNPADLSLEITCKVLERAAELIEKKNPTGASIKQAVKEMKDFAKRHKGKPIKEINLP